MKTLLVHHKKVYLTLTIIGLFVAITAAIYFYFQYQQAQQLLHNPTEAARQEIKSLIGRVGMLIELPAEEPTVATVSDVRKLAGQAFFAHAKEGDKVLIYPTAKKAILYRPSTNKLIEVSAVSVNPAGQQIAGVSTTSGPVRIVLYNGTVESGLANSFEKQMQAIPELQGKVSVISKQNATKKTYATTLVIPLSDVRKADAQVLATLLNGTVAALPAGETKPTGDILIIIGK